jgi:F-type H+-transporting ATPase subunit gamma
MSDTMAGLRRKIASAGDLQSVVHTMKALAASSIGQYERSMLGLEDYARAVEVGLGVCLRRGDPITVEEQSAGRDPERSVGAVVFGSDQGLVGSFNEVVVDYATKTLATLSHTPRIWAIGERVHGRLREAHLPLMDLFTVPGSVQAITPLVGRILAEYETQRDLGNVAELHLFHNRPVSGQGYEPVHHRLLPLDEVWRRQLADRPWPTTAIPEILGGQATLRALIREFLFITLFRACAESLASENTSRLAAMERADRNIDELLAELCGSLHRLRQSGIDEELFDVISGFEALADPRRRRGDRV